MSLLSFLTWVVVITAVDLVVYVAGRWLGGDWLPIHSDHVPLDFARLTIGGIPMEELYGPDAVHHPYRLSEPDETPPWLFTNDSIFSPPPGGYFNADLAIWQAAARLSAQQMKPGDLLRHINPC